MKHKMLALVLALTIVSWAQTSTQAAPSDQQQSTEKAKCACCDKMASADSKDAKMCARHGKHAKNAKCCAGKNMASCCGTNAKCCMKDDKTASGCCKECGNGKTASNCCGKDCKEGCCSKKTEAAMSCCHHQSHS